MPIPEPGPGELRVRVQAVPLNLNDIDRITGANIMVRADLPSIPGMEVMGVVDACGEVRAVVGSAVGFDEVPAALEAMANRETIGRTIVRLS